MVEMSLIAEDGSRSHWPLAWGRPQRPRVNWYATWRCE
jgi:hypothetical protein